MCYLKSLRYGQSSHEVREQQQLINNEINRQTLKEEYKTEWDQVDYLLEDAIVLYCDIRYKKRSGAWQPIFIDLIIRLIIARSFVLNKTNRPVSAHKLLDRAENLLEMVKNRKLEIQTDPEIRA